MAASFYSGPLVPSWIGSNFQAQSLTVVHSLGGAQHRARRTAGSWWPSRVPHGLTSFRIHRCAGEAHGGGSAHQPSQGFFGGFYGSQCLIPFEVPPGQSPNMLVLKAPL